MMKKNVHKILICFNKNFMDYISECAIDLTVKRNEISVEDFIGKSKEIKLVFARAIFAACLKDVGYKNIEIAKYINRNHSTVTNLLNIYKNEIANNSKNTKSLLIIKNEINKEIDFLLENAYIPSIIRT